MSISRDEFKAFMDDVVAYIDKRSAACGDRQPVTMLIVVDPVDCGMAIRMRNSPSLEYTKVVVESAYERVMREPPKVEPMRDPAAKPDA